MIKLLKSNTAMQDDPLAGVVVKGLQQYAYAYEECQEQANEIGRIYSQAVAGDVDLNHMASVIRQENNSTLAMNDGGIAMHFNHTVLAGGYRG